MSIEWKIPGLLRRDEFDIMMAQHFEPPRSNHAFGAAMDIAQQNVPKTLMEVLAEDGKRKMDAVADLFVHLSEQFRSMAGPIGQAAEAIKQVAETLHRVAAQAYNDGREGYDGDPVGWQDLEDDERCNVLAQMLTNRALKYTQVSHDLPTLRKSMAAIRDLVSEELEDERQRKLREAGADTTARQTLLNEYLARNPHMANATIRCGQYIAAAGGHPKVGNNVRYVDGCITWNPMGLKNAKLLTQPVNSGDNVLVVIIA